METKPAPERPEAPGFGIARDVRQLRTHSAASAAELREFLARMKGRSPQEVLGMVAGSRLMRSVATATLGAAALLVVFTVVPWLLSSPAAAKSKAGPAKTAAAPAEPRQAQEPPPSPSAQPPAPVAAPVAQAKPSPADAEKAVKVMGLGDTKVADPKTNPLEKSLDNLLDKLE